MNEPRSRYNGPYEHGFEITTGPGNLRTLRAHNKGASTIYLLLFDIAGFPASGAAPSSAPIPIPAGTYYESDTRFDFKLGLFIMGSTTAAIYTAAADDLWVSAQYDE